MFRRRRIKLDKKSGIVKISDTSFKVKRRDNTYYLQVGTNLLNLLGDVRFEELPESFMASTYLLISRPFAAFAGASIDLDISRDGLSASFRIDRQQEMLVDIDEYARELVSSLRNKGFNVAVRDDSSYVANYVAQRFEMIGQVVQNLDNVISAVNQSAAEREESLRKQVDGWVSRLGNINGRFLASRKDVYGLARWLLTPLNQQDIAYILFNSIPPSFNLGERMAGAIVGKVVKNMQETINKLIGLGLIRRKEDSGLVYTSIGSALKQLLERVVLEAKAQLKQSQDPAYDPITLLHYIGRNFPSLALSNSSKLRGNKKGLYRYVEKMLHELTFIHVVVILSIFMNIHVPKFVIDEVLETIVRLGFVSNRMRIKPFGKWVAILARGYLRKTGILKKDNNWKSVFNWQSLLQQNK